MPRTRGQIRNLPWILAARAVVNSSLFIPLQASTDMPFRHQMLTYLTAQGLSDAQIQLISGHASKKSLEVYYQHLSLEAVEDAYQAAVRASVGFLISVRITNFVSCRAAL
jgi:hypothetical protein